MNIQSAEYLLWQNRPALRLVIEGKEALICDYKPALLEAGYVALSSREPHVYWEQLLEPLIIPPTSGICEHPLYMESMTTDPAIVALAQEFHRVVKGQGAKPFAIGAIPLPPST